MTPLAAHGEGAHPAGTMFAAREVASDGGLGLSPAAMTPYAATSPSIDVGLAELEEEFELLGDWEERYRHVIDLGRDLAPLTEAERTDANKVRGCASQVWLVTEPGEDGRLRFRGDSDAHIVRGLIAILMRLYSGRKPSEIGGFDVRGALGRLGLTEALSRQRSNGLFSMIERIKGDARAMA